MTNKNTSVALSIVPIRLSLRQIQVHTQTNSRSILAETVIYSSELEAPSMTNFSSDCSHSIRKLQPTLDLSLEDFANLVRD